MIPRNFILIFPSFTMFHKFECIIIGTSEVVNGEVAEANFSFLWPSISDKSKNIFAPTADCLWTSSDTRFFLLSAPYNFSYFRCDSMKFLKLFCNSLFPIFTKRVQVRGDAYIFYCFFTHNSSSYGTFRHWFAWNTPRVQNRQNTKTLAKYWQETNNT